MDIGLQSLLDAFSLPQYGLSTVFVVSFVSATLLPMGSEPVVFALVKLNPELFWPAIFVATLGNTLGGALDWWMGMTTDRVVSHFKRDHVGWHSRAGQWLQRLGPKACLLAWLPAIGDPLCAVAGYFRLPFWPCLFYMAIGKWLRYVIMTDTLLWLTPKMTF